MIISHVLQEFGDNDVMLSEQEIECPVLQFESALMRKLGMGVLLSATLDDVRTAHDIIAIGYKPYPHSVYLLIATQITKGNEVIFAYSNCYWLGGRWIRQGLEIQDSTGRVRKVSGNNTCISSIPL